MSLVKSPQRTDTMPCSGWDADASYPAPEESEKREVVQPPTEPAYKEYLDMRR